MSLLKCACKKNCSGNCSCFRNKTYCTNFCTCDKLKCLNSENQNISTNENDNETVTVYDEDSCSDSDRMSEGWRDVHIFIHFSFIFDLVCRWNPTIFQFTDVLFIINSILFFYAMVNIFLLKWVELSWVWLTPFNPVFKDRLSKISLCEHNILPLGNRQISIFFSLCNVFPSEKFKNCEEGLYKFLNIPRKIFYVYGEKFDGLTWREWFFCRV
jgi:hypothetical protein